MDRFDRVRFPDLGVAGPSTNPDTENPTMKKPRQPDKSATWRPCWKLTDSTNKTHFGTCLWVPGEANPTGKRSGLGGLCGPGFYHAYESPYMAALFNLVHAAFNSKTMKLWAAEWKGTYLDDYGRKFGATEMRIIRQVKIPVLTDDQARFLAHYVRSYALPDDHGYQEEVSRHIDPAANLPNDGHYHKEGSVVRYQMTYLLNHREPGQDALDPVEVFESGIAWALTLYPTPKKRSARIAP